MANMVRSTTLATIATIKAMNINITMTKIITVSITKPPRVTKEVNSVKRKVTKKDRRPQDITTSPTRMNIIRNINSTTMPTKVDTTANTAISTHITPRKVATTKRVTIMSPLSNRTNMERKAIMTKDITTKITKDTKANTDTSPTMPIMKTMVKRVAAPEERNTVSMKVERSISALNVQVSICYFLFYVFVLRQIKPC